MIDQIKHLAGILTFTGQIGTATRMYSKYNQSGDNRQDFTSEDVMLLSDTLVLFEFLGKEIEAGNSLKGIELCDAIVQTLRSYIGQPAFSRNPIVDLDAAIAHVGGLRAALS